MPWICRRAESRRESNGQVTVKQVDLSNRRAPKGEVKGALPFTAAPAYKPEFQAKVKDLIDHESRTDPVFYCGKPGVPRIGPPRKIVQLPNEMIFLYEDMSGDTYRVIPTDGRPHRADANPGAYGDSIAHWEGDTLVVDVTNFDDNTWFGEGGYFHTDAMHVTERLWLEQRQSGVAGHCGRSQGSGAALDRHASRGEAVERASGRIAALRRRRRSSAAERRSSRAAVKLT